MPIEQRGCDKKILILDEDPYTRKFFHSFLREFPAVVMTLGDGEEAVRLMEREPFDLLFVDAHLPRFIKRKVFEGIVAQKGRPITVLMLGLWQEPAGEPLAYEINCRYLRKPFDLALLKRIVNQSLV
ncbi:MAG: response regulator [bacterium]